MQFFNTVYLAVKQSRPLIQNYRVSLPNDVQNHVLRQSFNAFSSASSGKDVISTLPEKPKRPLSIYIRYSETVRPKLIQQFPDKKITEIAKLVSEMYKKLDKEDLARLTLEYEAEKKLYEKEVEKYNSKLTEEQKNALAALKTVAKKEKERKLVKKLEKESNKPKRPANAYLLYSSDRRKEEGYTGDIKEWTKKISSEWKALPEDVKKKYATKVEQLSKQYEADKAKWEASVGIEYPNLVSQPKPSNLPSPSTKSKSKVSKNMVSSAQKGKVPQN